eukprot:scaffold11713_cov19-Tisochrysis_lutea.AAC.2
MSEEVHTTGFWPTRMLSRVEPLLGRQTDMQQCLCLGCTVAAAPEAPSAEAARLSIALHQIQEKENAID